jgi:Uma2 family endonuclease
MVSPPLVWSGLDPRSARPLGALAEKIILAAPPMTLTTAKWTLDQYHQMIDADILADRSVELLNGEIIEMAPEGEPHAYANTEARDYLIALLGDRAKIRDAKPISIPSSNSEPEPDLAIVRPLGQVYRVHHPYPEDIFWVIEFSDASLKKDLDPKAKVYAAAGIVEYWVVNLKTSVLIVLRNPVAGDYQQRLEYRTGFICPVAFPDLAIDITRLMQ